VDRQHIVAVQRDTRQAVGGAARRDARVAGGVLEGNLGGELVVLADEQHRQPPDARHVEPLVEGAVVDGPVAEERHRHALALEQLEAVTGPRRLQDARANDAARAHHADFRRKQVHAAAPAVRAAGLAAEQLRYQLARGNALGQRVAVAAVGAEDDVVGAEVGADAGRNRLLPDVGMTGTVDQAALVAPGQFFFALADRLHLAVEGQQLGLIEVRVGLLRLGHRC